MMYLLNALWARVQAYLTYTRTRAGQPTRTEDLLHLTRTVLGPQAADLLNAWITQPDLP